MSNKPDGTMEWSTARCANPTGWTSVGYIKRGPQCGTFVPVHHWHSASDAACHVIFLNRGIDRSEALALMRGLSERPATDNGEQS